MDSVQKCLFTCGIDTSTPQLNGIYKVDVVGKNTDSTYDENDEKVREKISDLDSVQKRWFTRGTDIGSPELNSMYKVDAVDKLDTDSTYDEDEEDDDDGEDDGDYSDVANSPGSSKISFSIFPIVTDKQDEAKNTSMKKEEEADLISWDNTYLDMPLNEKTAAKNDSNLRSLCQVEEVMKKTVIKPGFETMEKVGPYSEGERLLRKKRKKERERSKGSGWYDMPATEMTEEVKHDLEVIQMRSLLDPKHFYKKNDLSVLPKYFQIGRVADNAADFYHSRIPKKQRKKTIVEELLADSEFKRYNKKRYKEIIEERRKTHYKAHNKAKKLKRNK